MRYVAVLAGLALVQSHSVTVDTKTFLHTIARQFEDVKLKGPQLRKIVGVIEAKIVKDDALTYKQKLQEAAVTDYGCNCRSRENYLDSNPRVTTDALDEVCAGYVNALKCVQLEYPKCDVATVEYAGMLSIVVDGDKITVSCDESDKAGRQCAYNTCLVDIQFFIDETNAIADSGRSDAFDHFKGFRTSESCGTPEVTGKCRSDYGKITKDPFATTPDECCGMAPYKVPYDSTKEGCCDIVADIFEVFDLATQFCCPDGSVGPSCSIDKDIIKPAMFPPADYYTKCIKA